LTHKVRAKKENRIFFRFWEDAIKAGFRDCSHMPFGLTGGLALSLKQTRNGRFKITCVLCDKYLGYAQKDKQGRIRWKDGFIISCK